MSISCGPNNKAGEKSMQEVAIFYIPFDFQTYIGITTDSIEKNAICRFSISSGSKEAVSLRQTLGNSTIGKFDNDVVRLKASGLVEQEVFIDMDGGVLFGRGGVEKRLPDNDFKTLRTLMESLAKQHSCDQR
jgi:hypothetical protein